MLLFWMNLQIRLLDLIGIREWELASLDVSTTIGPLDVEPLGPLNIEV